MIDGHIDEYENAFLQDLSLSEFSHSLGHERKSETASMMSASPPRTDLNREFRPTLPPLASLPFAQDSVLKRAIQSVIRFEL